VVAGYIVRKADGTPITATEPSEIRPTSLGRVSRMVGTRLNAVPPGNYIFELSVKDELSGKRLEIKEPFTIVAPKG
jgi:hypothetical protein